MFALTTPTTCVAAVARPGPERPRGVRGASLAGRHAGSTGGDRVAMRVGGARSARSVRTAATEGTRGSGSPAAPDIARRTIGGTPGTASASVHARASPAACRSTTASIHFHRASQVAKGTLGVESGRVPGSMTSHFFEDGFFFSNRFCIPTTILRYESARERPRD